MSAVEFDLEPKPVKRFCHWQFAYSYTPCGGEAVEGLPVCSEHAGEKCVSCGTQAVRACSHAGQFVCGYPLCGDCDHEGGGHVRRRPDKCANKEPAR